MSKKKYVGTKESASFCTKITMNGYYTHRKFLEIELLKLDYSKPVKCLEFGTGDGSALLFNSFAKTHKNMLVNSYDNDSLWVKKTTENYALDNYIFSHIDSWDSILTDESFKDVYDLVFVDQAPWEARIKTIELFLDKAKVIILHDYDYFNQNFCEDISSVGEGSVFHKYSNKFHIVGEKEFLPPTLIMTKK